MADITIEPAWPEDRREAAGLLSHAMISLPESKAVFRGRRDRMEGVFRIMLKRRPGLVYVAKDGKHIVGVMRMVEWPQCNEAPLSQKIRLLPSMLWILKDTFPRAKEFRSIWASHDPQEPHWHLDPLAVLPARQGEGIGSRLLQHFCDSVDRLGAAAYLETATRDNVRLYERFGFSVTGEVSVLGVPTWLMWRPAST